MKWVIIIFALLVAMLVGNLLMLKHINKKSFTQRKRDEQD
jgi:hypothetical protein